MSKLNQSLKQELLRATEPKKLSIQTFGGSVDDIPTFTVDTDCEPSKGYEDVKYTYGLIKLFTDDATIELNKYLSRHYDFKSTHGYIRFSGTIGFRQREGNHISIDLSSLTLRHALFQERTPTCTGVLDRDASQDLIQAIVEQMKSPEHYTDTTNIIGMCLMDYIENAVPF